MENFSSAVCSALDPNSELVSPTLVWIQLLPPTPLPDDLAFFSLLKFWIGSQSEIPIIRFFGAGLFSLTVANADIAKIIVTLGGIRDGMVILISMGPPQAPGLRFGPQLGPGSSPGDALLQFILENFSSPVCSPLDPNSELVSPTLVWIKLLPPTPFLDDLAIFSLFKFWIGS